MNMETHTPKESLACRLAGSYHAARAGRTSVVLSALLAGAMALAALAVPSCSKSDATEQKSRGQGVVPVSAAVVVAKPVAMEIATFGTVQACASVAVKAQVSGALEAVHFVKGQNLKKGDPLFTIDARPFKAALDQAQANLNRDKIQLANARKEAQRESSLLAKGVAAQGDFDKSQADADALDAATAADTAAVQTAKLQLDRCNICSPIDGRAGNTLVDAGNLVQADSGSATLVTINQVQPIDVFFSIPQKLLPAVRKYMPQKLKARAWLPNEGDQVEIGELDFIDNTIDKSTGTVLLGATFANEDERLWPGQYVNVVLTLTVQNDSLVIPARAVQTGRDGKFVFVIKQDKTVEQRPVTIDRLVGQDAVVQSGLAVGESIVTDGQSRLADKSKIRIVDKDAASAPADRSASAPSGPTGTSKGKSASKPAKPASSPSSGPAVVVEAAQ